MEPNNTRIRWYVASCSSAWARMARPSEIFGSFVENDPPARDAQREIRLLRDASSRDASYRPEDPSIDRAAARPTELDPPPSAKPPEGGRFGKWFKR